MTDDTRKKTSLLNTLLKEYSIKDIISIFSTIDDKIIALHECSSDDFLTFNTHLKTFYKQAKTISDNASTIFDIIAGKDSRNIFNEFNAFHEKLKVHVDYFVKELNYYITTLNKIYTNLNFLFIPLKNFSQNLLTLKFLFTNLKLNLTNTENEDNGKHEREINRIEDLIDKIKSGYPKIDEELYRLKISIKEILAKLADINKKNEYNVEMILNQLHSNISILSSRHEEAILQIPKLSQKTEHCFNGISKIITNLQYHDIIRQKMEHIRTTYKELIKELNLIDENEDDKIFLFKQAKYAAQIPYIAELQIAQLIQTNKEFQNAIQIITSKFIEIGEDMASIAGMCQEIASYTHKSEETHFEQIQSKLRDATYVIKQFSLANHDFISEIGNIHTAIQNISQNFNAICELDSALQQLALKAIATSESSVKAQELSRIAQQIKTLTSDIRQNMNKSQFLFDQTVLLSEELYANHSVENEIEKNSSNLVKNVNNILEAIDVENHKVVGILDQNRNLSESILVKVKNAVDEIKYYDFFERTIEEIILELNNIYRNLECDSLNIKEAAQKKELDAIEKFYTTKSEREIHHEVIEDESDIELFNNPENKETEDNNLELF